MASVKTSPYMAEFTRFRSRVGNFLMSSANETEKRNVLSIRDLEKKNKINFRTLETSPW